MFEKRVIIGKKYCVITPGQTLITTSINNAEVILLNVSDYNKYFFIAPTSKIYSSIDPSCIFEANDLTPFNKNKNLACLPNLTAALKILLSDIKFKINFKNNKLVLHTDRISDDKLETINILLDKVIPANIKVVRYNHDISIPWQEIPEGFTVVEWLESPGFPYFSINKNIGTTEDDTEVVFTKLLPPSYGEILSLEAVLPETFKQADIQFNSNPRSTYNVALFQTVYSRTDGSSRYPSDGTCGYFRLKSEGRDIARFSARKCYLNGEYKGMIDSEHLLPAGPLAVINTLDGYFNARIWGLTHRSNETGELLVDLIPCVDDTGAPCMLDRVTRTIYYNAGAGDFLYPGKEEEPATYSLRRPITYAQLTKHGVRRLYHVPKGYNGTKKEYASENGFKSLVETPTPEEGYWEPLWRETEDEIILEWMEAKVPE